MRQGAVTAASPAAGCVPNHQATVSCRVALIVDADNRRGRASPASAGVGSGEAIESTEESEDESDSPGEGGSSAFEVNEAGAGRAMPSGQGGCGVRAPSKSAGSLRHQRVSVSRTH